MGGVVKLRVRLKGTDRLGTVVAWLNSAESSTTFACVVAVVAWEASTPSEQGHAPIDTHLTDELEWVELS